MTTEEKSETENITGPADTTVQLLGIDPYSNSRFLQGHNLLESTVAVNVAIIAMYGGRSKPPNVGNLGGGVEPNELKLFEEREPELFEYYSSLGTLSAIDMVIIACARREGIDEGGFDDFEILLDNGKPLILTDYRYKEGHRVVTVGGKFRSYNRRPIKEGDEIDYVDWVDFSLSMFEVYRRLRREIHGEIPVYPYWSHMRRINRSVSVLDRYRRDREEMYYPINRIIHPSWKTGFPVGRGDKSFPYYGYQISPEDWYHMFDIMMEKEIEDLDNDTLLREFNGRSRTKVLVYDYKAGKYSLKERKLDLNLARKIAFAKDYQERKLEQRPESSKTAAADVIANNTDLAGSEDYSGASYTVEVLKAENEEYLRRQEAEDQEYAEWLRK